ncbi:hypothetical protein CLHUN_32520 [Ruminiclostridium hungatei]|uniref:Hint domain-containing protein n=1 Tax=Ruminiclostridium hungatei TaxID=48256 RepID=A0A1V4SGD1_RUMHU|nr:hypothetical protein CLHUN_32520 [Ruminiclostridium hungatei]
MVLRTGIGALGAVAGKSIQCLSTLGKVITVTSKVTMAISLGLDGLDILSMGIGLFEPSNPLVKFNKQFHSNALYNGLQITVNAIAIFTAGAASTLKCFVAGTMILTATGLVAIESIKAGGRVISTNIDSFEVAEKTVIETYIRETTELVHLTISGELIKTTFEHPFYVKDVGFVNAGELVVGNEVLDSSGNVLLVENIKVEITNEPTKVYNFQVDDFHTYHVGNNGVLVHNANYNKGGGKTIKSVNDIIKNPASLQGKTKADIAKILGEGWTEGAYGSNKTGWKFTKGDQSIFYHPGGGRHGGSYYGYSSAATGKVKVVGPDYIPIPGDKATIIYGGK